MATSVGTLTELKAAYGVKTKAVQEGMEKGVKVEDGNVVVSQEVKDQLQSDLAAAHEIKALIDMSIMAEKGEKFWDEVDVKAIERSQAMQEAAREFQMSHKSLGEMLTDSVEFKDMLSRKSATMNNPMELNSFDIAQLGQVKNVYGSMDPGTIQRNFGTIQFDPTVPRGQRRARVRDLFPVASTSANLIDFFQVIGFAENNALTGSVQAVSGGSGNAAPVADWVVGSPGNFGLKNKSNLVFRSNQAPVRTVAHWEAAHRNVLDDAPQLQSTINNELLYGLALEEDYQILLGSGANEDLTGILNTPNIQTYTAPSHEIMSDTLRKAATLSIIANYPSTGYVLHPNDWEKIETQKGSGDGQYMLFTNISIGAAATVWRNPVVETTAMAEGTFLTGAFGTGAQLYDRQQANIRIAEQHADFFVRNAVVVLAEERLALAVKRPEAFIKGTFVYDAASISALVGPAGTQGAQGNTGGAQGAQGTQGNQGVMGTQGTQGIHG